MGYGTSIALDSHNDFQFDPISNRLVLVRGVDNCRQAICVMLKIIKGELRFYPDFGLDLPQLLEKNISDNNIKHAMTTAITRDPRIKSVDNIIIERNDRVLNIYMYVTTHDNVKLEYQGVITW